MESITITIRGEEYSRELPTQAVDLMLSAFRDQYNDLYCPRDVDGNQIVMLDTEFFALCIRKHSIDVAKRFATKLDSQMTPNMDAIQPLISTVDT